MRVVIDLEASDLLPFTKDIWVTCAINIDTGEMYSYRTKEELLADCGDWTTIIGHGILSYDLWVLWKVYGLSFACGPDQFDGRPVTFIDTLVTSRYANPDRHLGHGLEIWGDKLRFRKTEWTDFSAYCEEMEAYCFNDCLLTAKVFKELKRETSSG